MRRLPARRPSRQHVYTPCRRSSTRRAPIQRPLEAFYAERHHPPDSPGGLCRVRRLEHSRIGLKTTGNHSRALAGERPEPGPWAGDIGNNPACQRPWPRNTLNNCRQRLKLRLPRGGVLLATDMMGGRPRASALGMVWATATRGWWCRTIPGCQLWRYSCPDFGPSHPSLQ